MRHLFPTLLLLPLAAVAAEPIRVACVGDSITFGAGAAHRETESYPAQLQAMLGEIYEVKNFGVSGSTMLRQGDKPYHKQKACADALAMKADVYILKLGTNDSNPHNWKFKDQFTAANPAARIYVCLPVPAYPGNWGINEPVIGGEIVPALKKVAEEEKVLTIDLHTALSNHPEYFPDKVHPNSAGYRALAAAVYQSLTGRAADLEKIPAQQVPLKKAS
jgi:lysophospholipase L1-like esterase